MEEQPRPSGWLTTAGAVLLWLLTFVLGLNAMYTLLQIFYLVYGAFGGNLDTAQRMAPVMIFFLGLVFLVFIIASSEYHRQHAGSPGSWRLFAWTLAVEISILVLFYLL